MVAVDISTWQGFPNFNILANDISHVITRAGTLEGGGMLQDSKLTYNRSEVRRIGRGFGTYLFNGPVDPVKAAEWYVNIIDYRPGDLTAIDVESPNAWGPSQVLAFHQRVKELIGVVPATYGSSSLLFQDQWKQVSDFGSPLWVANYGANTGSPGRDPGNGPWARRILWQFTYVAQHSGFSGAVDTNQINDSVLAEYLGGSTPTPQEDDSMSAQDVSDLKAYIDSKSYPFHAYQTLEEGSGTPIMLGAPGVWYHIPNPGYLGILQSEGLVGTDIKQVESLNFLNYIGSVFLTANDDDRTALEAKVADLAAQFTAAQAPA